MTWRIVVRAEWDRSVTWVMAVAALVVMMIGSRQVASSPFASDAVAHLIAGGLGGLLLLVGSVAALLSADLRDEVAKLRTLEALLGRPGGTLPSRRIRPPFVVPGALGIVVVVLGWRTAAGTGDLDRALGGLAVAAVGALLAGAGAAFHTLAERRRVRIGVRAVLAAASTAIPAAEQSMVDGGRYTVDGLSRHHRRSCMALASAQGPVRRIEAVTVLEPCLICHGEG